jgi:isoamylase
VAMLNAGDEICRTQAGNNNAYCQDNQISWHDWSPTPTPTPTPTPEAAMMAFTARAVRLQAAQPALRRNTFLTAEAVTWLGANGQPMQDWDGGRFLGWLLRGDKVDLLDDQGAPLRGDDVLVLANARDEAVTLPLPGRKDITWTVALDTSTDDGAPGGAATLTSPQDVTVQAGCLLVATAPSDPH